MLLVLLCGICFALVLYGAMETAHAILEKKQLLEEDLKRVEAQIYDLEGEYLQVRYCSAFLTEKNVLCLFPWSPILTSAHLFTLCRKPSKTETSCVVGTATLASKPAVAQFGG